MGNVISAAIAENDGKDLSLLAEAVKNWAEEQEQELEVSLFPSVSALKEYLNDGDGFDIYILGVSDHGIELGKQIRRRYLNVPIIYIAGSRTHAFDAYSLHALRYIMKPADPEELASALEFACIVHRALPKNTLTVRLTGAVTNVSADDVVYIENNVRSMKYVMKDGTFINGTRRNISFEKFFGSLLATGRFVQTHKSFIVNVSCIRALRTTSASMSNGVNVPISRRHINEVHRCYEKFEMK